MKRYIILLSLILATIACCVAQNEGSQRVILKAARQFDNVVVSGAAVVELKYDARHGGYIYYNTNNNSAPRITAQNFDGGILRISADSTANALTTRITVLYDTPLQQVMAVDSAIVVSRNLVTSPDVVLISNTKHSDSGIFAKELKADNVMLILHDGDMGFKNLKANVVVVNSNNDSRLRLLNCRAANLEINAQESSQVIIGGKVSNMMVNVDNTSAVHTDQLKCKTLTANLCGDGSLHTSTPGKLTVNQLGNGVITMRRYPHDVESNVGYDAILIEK